MNTKGEGKRRKLSFPGEAFSKLEMFVWILNHISRSITWSLYTLEASYLVNDQSLYDLSCGGVSLSIC